MPNKIIPLKTPPPVAIQDLREPRNLDDTRDSGADKVKPDMRADGHAEQHATPNTPGEILRAARQASGLSLGDVANRLRMGVKQVEALEHDHYEPLPKGTFLRGFVRNYAKVLHIDAERVIALLESSHEDARLYRGPSIVVPTQNIEVATPGGKLANPKARLGLIAVVVTLLALAGWYWWKFIYHPAAQTAPVTASEPASTVAASSPSSSPFLPFSASPPSSTSSPAPASIVVPVSQPKDPVVPTVNKEATLATKATDNPATLPTPASQIALAAESSATETANTPSVARSDAAPSVRASSSRGVIGFSFSGDSWVEVIDGTGRTVLQARFKAGSTEEVVGRPPFSIVVGNAPATRMVYNGKEFDLAPHTKTTTARVKLK